MFNTPKKLLLSLLIFLLAGLALPANLAASPLVDNGWLADNLTKPGIVVLDVRSNPKAFVQAHIPGSIATHYGKDGWRVNKGKVHGLLPDMAALEKLIGGLGIGNDDTVVLIAPGFGPGDMAIATRIYWTFKVAGHDKISILNGGFAAWAAASLPMETGPAPLPTAKTFKTTLNKALLATEEDVRQALGDGTILIDNRSQDQYLGAGKKGRPGPGTIKGAQSLPSSTMTQSKSGLFKHDQTLAMLYDAAGIKTTGKTITFCNTGHWASLGWFVSHELLGNRQARLYDGSMSEWSQNPANPVMNKK